MSSLGSEQNCICLSSNTWFIQQINGALISLAADVKYSLLHHVRFQRAASCDEVRDILVKRADNSRLDSLCIIDLTSTNPLPEFDWKVDSQSPDDFFIARLILEFPEVYFVCIAPKAAVSEDHQKSLAPHLILTEGEVFDPAFFDRLAQSILNQVELHAMGRRNWFDSSGVAANIVEKFPKNSTSKKAIVIDEEASYCLFNGYIAYVHGYNTDIVSSHDYLKKVNDILKNDNETSVIIFEDVELNFKGMSNDDTAKLELKNRAKNYVGIFGNRNKRVLISAGKKPDLNIEPEPVFIKKPHGGVYCNKLLRALEINPGDFHLPKRFEFEQTENQSNHSAKYVEQDIAEALKNRARIVFSSAKTLHEYILVCLLCIQAMRLLKGLTVTIVKECLDLLSHSEVMAESIFFGTESGSTVKRRLRTTELIYDKHVTKEEADKFEQWQKATFLMEVFGHFRKVYLQTGRFDDESLILQNIRKQHLQQNKTSPILARVGLKYMYWMIKRLSNILQSAMLWIIFWAWLFTLALTYARHGIVDFDLLLNQFPSVLNGVLSGFVIPDTTVMVELVNDVFGNASGCRRSFELLLKGVAFAITVTGIAHTGIFLAYLYQKISRR